MKRAHCMPFGAELVEGATRFRLWAPDAARIDLVIEDGLDAPMPAVGDGWWHLDATGIGAGALYRFRIDGGLLVPDPASRFQPRGVHGPSAVVDAGAFDWSDEAWRGRPWAEAVLYELHVGSFSPEGNFAGVEARLDHFVDLGVSAIELMPIAAFDGARGWGYDGVLPFAPSENYGAPEDLKRLVQAAHARRLMVLLDVVYNHFGPSGSYLHAYAKRFFNEDRHTPWGAAINFDGAHANPVRGFFAHNAAYWIEEYGFDGLRLDAVHGIEDASEPHILETIAEAVRAEVPPDRHVHLVLENDDNATRYLERDERGRPRFYTAQWNDDIHHALHVLATGEVSGYYEDYADRPLAHLARCLEQGFAYQGEASMHRAGAHRGSPSAHLPPDGFVAFLQNHDQIGNRALGDRLTRLAPPEVLDCLAIVLLLSPEIPLIFMGEEWGSRSPFQYFCDFDGDLADAVREGRRREFSRFEAFRDGTLDIPDPLDLATFEASRLDWDALVIPEHRATLERWRSLLAVRGREITPLLASGSTSAEARVLDQRAIDVIWRFRAGALRLIVNPTRLTLVPAPAITGRLIAATSHAVANLASGELDPWGCAVFRLDRE